MAFDLPPKLWLPPKPAIIRAASLDDAKLAMPLLGTFGAASVRGLKANAAAGGITCTFIDKYNDNVDRSTYTASAVNLNYDKIIACVHTSNTSADPTSVTINGTAATKIVSATGGSAHNTSIWIADITPTASGDIVVVHGGTRDRFTVGWYGVTGLTSTTATDTGSGTSATSFSDTLTTVAGGFLIIAATPGYIADGANTYFTGTGLSENYDQVQDSDVRGLAALAATSGTSLAISGTYTGATYASTVAASWGT